MNQRPAPNFDFARAYSAAPLAAPDAATVFSDDKEPDQPAHLLGEELDDERDSDEPTAWAEDVETLAQGFESWR